MKNRAKKSVKILSCAMALMLTATMGLCTSFAFGAEKNVKDESVYVITNNDGSQKDVIVSDHLCNKTESERLIDKSNLSKIENVKGKEKFTEDEKGNLIWEASKNDIYYQGNSDKAAPVKMSIKYYLNGKAVSGDALKGKSGAVKIVVDFDNTTDVPFIALTGFMAEDKSMKNIKVSSGKVIDDGEKQIVVGMAAPGLAENLGVSASKIGFSSQMVFTGEAEDFSVDSMMTIVTNDIFEDIDTSSLSGLKFDDQIELLDSSAKKLVEGSNTLYRGLNYMNNKSQELTVGVNKLNEGTAKLSQELNTNLNKLKSGAGQLQAGSSTLYSGAVELQGAVNGDGTATNPGLVNGATAVASGIADVSSKSTAGVSEDQTALNYIEGNANCKAAIITTIGADEYTALVTSIKTSQGIHKGIADTTANTGNLGAGSNKVKDGAVAVRVALNGDGTATHPGMVNGIMRIKNGADQLMSGLEQATADSNSLTSGAKELAEGMDQLNKNTGTLIAGVNKLNIGSQTLSRGMEEFYNEGIAKIVKLYNNDLKGISQNLDSTIKAGKSYNSFTQLPDGMKGSVKFIYKTELGQ